MNSPASDRGAVLFQVLDAYGWTLIGCCGMAMLAPLIRPATPSEYDGVTRLWMDSWCSTGIEEPSEHLLSRLRQRVREGLENGWSLFVADDQGRLVAMLALHIPKLYLDQLFVSPGYQGKSIGRQLLAHARSLLPEEIWLRCVRENSKAWQWYERDGFRLEKEELDSRTGFTMKYYRWKKDADR